MSLIKFLFQDHGTWKPLASNKECGTSLNRENFVGGENTKLGAYPFMALLGIYEFNKNK